MKITAHTLVKNEARFLWFSVMSVISHVDQVLLWDTGSTDGTLEVIERICKTKLGKSKVKFKQVPPPTPETFADVRQKMLDETETPWFLMVDGDEVWWEDSIRQVVSEIKKKGETLESIVVPTINPIGDIYHYQEEAAGQYHLAGKSGHLNLRAINRGIPGLASYGPHGTWGWVDAEQKMIQDRDQKKISFIEAPYMHFTYLPRAGILKTEQDVPKRAMKRKYELGTAFPGDFYYPEVFFRPTPQTIHSPWERRDRQYTTRAFWQTPLKKIRRRLIPYRKAGY